MNEEKKKPHTNTHTIISAYCSPNSVTSVCLIIWDYICTLNYASVFFASFILRAPIQQLVLSIAFRHIAVTTIIDVCKSSFSHNFTSCISLDPQLRQATHYTIQVKHKINEEHTSVEGVKKKTTSKHELPFIIGEAEVTCRCQPISIMKYAFFREIPCHDRIGLVFKKNEKNRQFQCATHSNQSEYYDRLLRQTPIGKQLKFWPWNWQPNRFIYPHNPINDSFDTFFSFNSSEEFLEKKFNFHIESNQFDSMSCFR